MEGREVFVKEAYFNGGKGFFFKAVLLCTLKASSVLGLPGRGGQRVMGSEARGQPHRQRDVL